MSVQPLCLPELQLVGADGISDDASDAEDGVLAQSGAEAYPAPAVVADELLDRDRDCSPTDGIVEDADDVFGTLGQFLQDVVSGFLDVSFQCRFGDAVHVGFSAVVECLGHSAYDNMIGKRK